MGGDDAGVSVKDEPIGFARRISGSSAQDSRRGRSAPRCDPPASAGPVHASQRLLCDQFLRPFSFVVKPGFHDASGFRCDISDSSALTRKYRGGRVLSAIPAAGRESQSFGFADFLEENREMVARGDGSNAASLKKPLHGRDGVETARGGRKKFFGETAKSYQIRTNRAAELRSGKSARIEVDDPESRVLSWGPVSGVFVGRNGASVCLAGTFAATSTEAAAADSRSCGGQGRRIRFYVTPRP